MLDFRACGSVGLIPPHPLNLPEYGVTDLQTVCTVELFQLVFVSATQALLDIIGTCKLPIINADLCPSPRSLVPPVTKLKGKTQVTFCSRPAEQVMKMWTASLFPVLRP